MEGMFPATSMPDRDWWAALWPDPAGVLRALGVRPGMAAVLDLCCGNGRFTVPLTRIAGGRAYALDLDPGMIAEAQAEADRQDINGIRWIAADARRIAELVPERVDLILIANAFHGVPDQPSLARAVADVLAPAGLLAVVNWHALPREQTTVLGQPRGPDTEARMAPGAVQSVVEPAGFRLVRSVELPPYHYGVIFERTA